MSDLTRSRDDPRGEHGIALLAAVLVLLAVALFAAAGFWQLQRAAYKDELRQRTEAAMQGAAIEVPVTPASGASLDFRAVQAHGEWRADKTIFIDNKIQDRVVGYHVVTPLRLGDGAVHVLVNRGWVAAPPQRSELPVVATPAGMVEVSGIARVPSDRFLELSARTAEGEQGRVWQNLTIARFQAWSGLAVQPIVVFQQNPGADGLRRVPVAPEASGLRAENHRGYALTWFGLAVVTLVLALAAAIRLRKK